MPVSLGELRTLVAESVRVQRIQELQQGIGRANQEVLTAQFQNVIADRRQSVKELEVIDRTRMDTESESEGQPEEEDLGVGEQGDNDSNGDLSEKAYRAGGVGGIIDLRGWPPFGGGFLQGERCWIQS